MYAARAARPRPKLFVSTSMSQNSLSLPLKSPVPGAAPRTPISPVAASPGARRFSTLQPPPQPAPYVYSNQCSSKSILKKHCGGTRDSHSHAADSKRIQFKGSPTVYCVTPIENPEEYYGSHHKVSRDERRWMIRD